MRILQFIAIVLCAVLVATPALARISPDKAGGSVAIASAIGTADVEFECFDAQGTPDIPGYVGPQGSLAMAASTPGYTFTMTFEFVDVQPGLAFMRGRDEAGRLWAVLVTDGGTPGSGNDAVWTVRYENDVPAEVAFWEVTAGNLKTHTY